MIFGREKTLAITEGGYLMRRIDIFRVFFHLRTESYAVIWAELDLLLESHSHRSLEHAQLRDYLVRAKRSGIREDLKGLVKSRLKSRMYNGSNGMLSDIYPEAIDWLIVRAIDPLIDWLFERLSDRSIVRLIDWLIVRAIDPLIDWLSDWLITSVDVHLESCLLSFLFYQSAFNVEY